MYAKEPTKIAHADWLPSQKEIDERGVTGNIPQTVIIHL